MTAAADERDVRDQASPLGDARGAIDALAGREQERKRLALELHDQTAQMLASALMLLRAADSPGDGSAAAEAGGHARQIISETIQTLRALAVELSPAVLADYGLTPALERLTATLADRSGLHVQLESSWNDRAADEVELTLFRVLQDALAAAVADHATGAVVAVRQDRDSIVVSVEQQGGQLHGRRARSPARTAPSPRRHTHEHTNARRQAEGSAPKYPRRRERAHEGTRPKPLLASSRSSVCHGCSANADRPTRLSGLPGIGARYLLISAVRASYSWPQVVSFGSRPSGEALSKS
jgi:hypothetical protein